MGKPDTHRYGPLLLIASLKLLKAAFLVVVAVGVLRLVHHDAQAVMERWANEVRIDPENRLVHKAIASVAGVSDGQLEAIALGTFLYAALFAVEGVGLLRRRVWAEYLTVVSTGLLLPIEVYELSRHATVVRAAVLVANLAILVYLIARLRSLWSERAKPQSA